MNFRRGKALANLRRQQSPLVDRVASKTKSRHLIHRNVYMQSRSRFDPRSTVARHGYAGR